MKKIYVFGAIMIFVQGSLRKEKKKVQRKGFYLIKKEVNFEISS